MSEARNIPHSPRYSFVGAIPQILGDSSVHTLIKLAEHYGPLFEVFTPGSRFYVATQHNIITEISDESRFQNDLSNAFEGTFEGARRFTGDSLQDFGAEQVRGFLPHMHQVVLELIRSWEKTNGKPINATEEFTKLTLETVALCGLNQRFNSFSSEPRHPFLDAVALEAGNPYSRTKTPKIHRPFPRKRNLRYFGHNELVLKAVDDITFNRLKKGAHPGAVHHDFLSHLLCRIDRSTGEKRDIDIRSQLLAFLIAGYETTRNLLGFATYFLTQNPASLARCREEADQVLDPLKTPTLNDINELKYTQQVLKETLRHWPAAPTLSRTSFRDTLVGERYPIRKGQQILVLLPTLHRDPEVWGQSSGDFDPDHFLPGRESQLPAFSYRPFGRGDRASIGQHFAMADATLVIAMILRHFDIKTDSDPKLDIRETLPPTLESFRIAVTPRRVKTLVSNRTSGLGGFHGYNTSTLTLVQRAPDHGTPLAIYVGCDRGICEDFATGLAEQAQRLGFIPKIAPLESAVGALPNGGAIVILVATTHGKPPQNAEPFIQWMKTKQFDPQSLYFSVVGLENAQWGSFQVFSKDIDQAFAQGGAIQVIDCERVDVNADLEHNLKVFGKKLFTGLSATFGIPLDLDTHFKTPFKRFSVSYGEPDDLKPLYSAFNAKPFKVIQNRELQHTFGDDHSERVTRHIELLLPQGVRYRTGDHFGVFSQNHRHLVYGVSQRLRLHLDTLVTIETFEDSYSSFLPINQSLSVKTLLTDYIELQDIVSKETLRRLIPLTIDEEERSQLTLLCNDTPEGAKYYQSEILNKQRSLFEILCLFPQTTVPFETFLEIVSPLRPRYYSISSSSLATPEKVSITVGADYAPARSKNGTLGGACSYYLHSRELGDMVYGFLRSSSESFRLPLMPEIPIILIGPDSGIAPLKGLLSERAAVRHHQNHLDPTGIPSRLGTSLLFLECSNVKHDLIYQRELETYASQKVVEIFVAFSDDEGSPIRSVQDLIKAQGNRVMNLMDQGAQVYISSGGEAMATGVKNVFLEMYENRYQCDRIISEQWLARLEATGRYCLEVLG